MFLGALDKHFLKLDRQYLNICLQYLQACLSALQGFGNLAEEIIHKV